MQPLRRYFDRQLKTATDQDVQLLGPVPQGQLWRVTMVAVSNTAGGSFGSHFRIGQPGANRAFSPRQTPAAFRSQQDLVDVWAFPDDFLFAHVDTLTGDADIVFVVMGRIYFACLGEPLDSTLRLPFLP